MLFFFFFPLDLLMISSSTAHLIEMLRSLDYLLNNSHIKPIIIYIQDIFISIRTSCCAHTPDSVHQLMIKVLIMLNVVMRAYQLQRWDLKNSGLKPTQSHDRTSVLIGICELLWKLNNFSITSFIFSSCCFTYDLMSSIAY